MTDDGLPLDVRIQMARYAFFRLLRANAPHPRLREEWSKLDALLDLPTCNGAEGAGNWRRCHARILRGWAKAYRDSPEHRFPSDPNAEFFPVDLENAADLLSRQDPHSSSEVNSES